MGFIEVKQVGNSLFLRGIEEFDEFSFILTEKPSAAYGCFGLRVSSKEYLTELKEWHDQMGIPNEYVAEGFYPGLGSCLKVV